LEEFFVRAVKESIRSNKMSVIEGIISISIPTETVLSLLMQNLQL
jgi:hypothetical protein